MRWFVQMEWRKDIVSSVHMHMRTYFWGLNQTVVAGWVPLPHQATAATSDDDLPWARGRDTIRSLGVCGKARAILYTLDHSRIQICTGIVLLSARPRQTQEGGHLQRQLRH